MKTRIIKGLILLVSVLSTLTIKANEKYKLNQEQSKLIINGTSTVHDWEMEANEFTCNLSATLSNQNLSIDDVKFICNADKILSDNSIMDSKTHNALKTDDFPMITFTMNSVELISYKEDGFSGEILGTLSIAGISKHIKIKFTGKLNNQSDLMVEGNVFLKMSDFNVEPPTAMFGALKTGNEIEIVYNFYFNKYYVYVL